MYIRCIDCLGLLEKLNIQNCVNPMRSYARWMYEFSRLAEIEYLELCKFNGKLCTIYVWAIWIYWESEFCGYVECIE